MKPLEPLPDPLCATGAVTSPQRDHYPQPSPRSQNDQNQFSGHAMTTTPSSSDPSPSLASASSEVGGDVADNPEPPPPACFESGFLDSMADWVSASTAIPKTPAFLLILSAVSAALGSSRTVVNPASGITLPASLNLLVVPPAGSNTINAIHWLMRSFTERLDERLESARLKDRRDLRLERVLLDQQIQVLNGYVKDGPPRPLDMPVTRNMPREQWIEDSQPAVLKQIAAVVLRQREIDVEMRPALIVNGIGRRDFVKIDCATFDGSLFNLAPDGFALRQLLGFCQSERLDVARFLITSWSGQPFTRGVDMIVHARLGNLWVLTHQELKRAIADPVLSGEAFFSTFFLAQWNTVAPIIDASSTADSMADNWNQLIDGLWKDRLRQKPKRHLLDESACRTFNRFARETRRLTAEDPTQTAVVQCWPQHVLKIALLLHTCSSRRAEPEISEETVSTAIEWVWKAGEDQRTSTQIPVAPVMQSTNFTELQRMLDKIRIDQPLRKRDLFRKYHDQDYCRLEHLLSQAIEQGTVCAEGGFLRIKEAQPRNGYECKEPSGVSVSASATA